MKADLGNTPCYNRSKEEIFALLKRKAINPTQQRLEIAHHVLKRAQHLKAEQVYQSMREGGVALSQATVYNTLKLFVKKGLLKELIISPSCVYYDSNTEAHHHSIDIESGKIEDIPYEKFSISIPSEMQDSIESISLLIRRRAAGKAKMGADT